MQAACRRGNRGTKKAAAKSASKQAAHVVLKPSLAEVLNAMRSLYVEQLRPFGRILRKRIGELACKGMVEVADVDAGHLRRVCESSEQIRVEQEGGGDWTALFAGQSGFFVDAYSPEDPYPSQLWVQAGLYFQSLSSTDYLPGGRYACAQELQKRQLPFFAGRSLGELCHIVQLAISQKRILGYLNGTLVPYCRSQTIMKEHAAQQHATCSRMPREQGLPLASMEATRQCLRQLLAEATMAGQMPLSNVKRLFRSRFGLELSETTLGFSKLCDLLANAAFADVCTVRLDWNGYTVVQVATPPVIMDQAIVSNQVAARPDHDLMYETLSTIERLPVRQTMTSEEPRRRVFCEGEPLGQESEEEFKKDEGARWAAEHNDDCAVRNTLVHNTFIHQPLVPVSPLPGAYVVPVFMTYQLA